MNELEVFYNYICIKDKFYCLNYKAPYGFSKNLFINNKESLKKFQRDYKNKDCYINYHPLKAPINRKTENVYGIHLIAFDIEYKNKIIPETNERMSSMLESIHEWINMYKKEYKIKSFIIINSGNGYHLYINIGKIIQKDMLDLKFAYKRLIKEMSKDLYDRSSGLISADDRKDLAGILRIPGTFNTKANKNVHLEEVRSIGENIGLRKLFFRIIREVKKDNKRIALNNQKNKNKYDGIKLPKNIDELIEYPLVRILFDKELPEKIYGSRHSSIIFALQSLIYHSGLQNKYEINQLSREVNIYCGISVDLSSCSDTKDLYHPMNCAIRFCKNNKYELYEKELRKLYIKKQKDL